jgi:hypothetical protein
VQGVEAKYNSRATGQTLGVKINNGTTVTPAQLDAAGYDVVFRASEDVFDGVKSSDNGELHQTDLQYLYDDPLGNNPEHIFTYTIEINKRSELIAESDEVEVEIYDGRTTAANSITSYRLDMLDDNLTGNNDPTGIKSNIMIEGETFGITNVKARTVAGGTDVNVTSGIKLATSDPWIVDVNDDDQNYGGAKTLTALSEGKATIVITSGTVTESFVITVKPKDSDNIRVPYTAKAEATTLKIASSSYVIGDLTYTETNIAGGANNGYDYVRVVVTDQYGDPFADENAVFFDKLETGPTPLVSGTTVTKKTTADPAYPIADVAATGLSQKGDTILKVTGLNRDNSQYLYFYGEKWDGAGVYKELARIKLDIGTPNPNYDASKSKFVAGNTDAVDFTVDHNTFDAKVGIPLHLMKYSSGGYALGAFQDYEYVESANYEKPGLPSAPAPKSFTLGYSRTDYIEFENYNPSPPPIVHLTGDIITIKADNELDPVNRRAYTGTVQLKSVIAPYSTLSSSTTVTRSQNIKVVSSVPEITKVSFESLTELDLGSYGLQELLLLENVVTEKTLGTGILYLRVPGSGLNQPYVELIYRKNSNDIVNVDDAYQVVGYIEFTNNADSILSFSYGDGYEDDYAVDSTENIVINVDNSTLNVARNVQFAVKKYGTTANVSTHPVKVRSAL